MFNADQAIEFFENRIGTSAFTDDLHTVVDQGSGECMDTYIARFVEFGTLVRPAGWGSLSELGKRLSLGYQTVVQFYRLTIDERYNSSMDEYRDQSLELLSHTHRLSYDSVLDWERSSPQTVGLEWWKRFGLASVNDENSYKAVVFSDSRVCHLNAVLDPAFTIDTGNVRDLYNLQILRQLYVPSFENDDVGCCMFYDICNDGRKGECVARKDFNVASYESDPLLQKLSSMIRA